MGRLSLRVAGAAAVAALAVVTAGCGSSASSVSSSATSTTTTTTPGTPASSAALKAFQDCMAQHGVKNFTPGAGRPPAANGAALTRGGIPAPPRAGCRAAAFHSCAACAPKRLCSNQDSKFEPWF